MLGVTRRRLTFSVNHRYSNPFPEHQKHAQKMNAMSQLLPVPWLELNAIVKAETLIKKRIVTVQIAVATVVC